MSPPSASILERLLTIYEGSDGDATKALFAELSALGAAGEVALNLFRAQKNSARAKVYRGGIRGQGSFKRMAYDRKAWAIDNLSKILARHAQQLQLRWGWQRDTAEEHHPWVLYADLPTGQVSFHATTRGHGPDYYQAWDGVVNASAGRILRWCEQLLAGGHGGVR